MQDNIDLLDRRIQHRFLVEAEDAIFKTESIADLTSLLLVPPGQYWFQTTLCRVASDQLARVSVCAVDEEVAAHVSPNNTSFFSCVSFSILRNSARETSLAPSASMCGVITCASMNVDPRART